MKKKRKKLDAAHDVLAGGLGGAAAEFEARRDGEVLVDGQVRQQVVRLRDVGARLAEETLVAH